MMNAYIYQADVYCEACGADIRARAIANRSPFVPADPDDETSYDSDEFPKGPYPDVGGEADFPQHCASGPECLDALELDSGHTLGAWLDNPLTADGETYARSPCGEVGQFWRHAYGLSVVDGWCARCEARLAAHERSTGDTCFGCRARARKGGAA